MDAKTILDRLGGYRAVAAILDLEPQAVHNWTRRFIPAAYWPKLARHAASTPGAEDITVDLLEASAPPRRTLGQVERAA